MRENNSTEARRINLTILGMSETMMTGYGKIKTDRYENDIPWMVKNVSEK